MTKKFLAILLTAAMLLTIPFVFSTAVAPVRRGDADRDGKISSGDVVFFDYDCVMPGKLRVYPGGQTGDAAPHDDYFRHNILRT